jgi:hypothetical protein
MKPILKKIFFGVLCALILIVMFCPQLHYRVGNVFFGGVPVLYNVNLAQYFFLYAAYPIVGKAPSYAHHQLSRTYFIQGQLPISVNEALKEMEIYPENVRTNYILGLTYGYMKHFQNLLKPIPLRGQRATTKLGYSLESVRLKVL